MEQSQSKDGIFPPYFYRYIRLVEDEDLHSFLQTQGDQMNSLFNSITEEKSHYHYGEGKWTIKEVLQHVMDAERVFAYRALAISRKDPNTLHSFDEKHYTANSNANAKSWEDLCKEFAALRTSTALFYNGFSDEQLNNTGKVSDYEMSVKALGYTIAGHAAHHIYIINERYLSDYKG